MARSSRSPGLDAWVLALSALLVAPVWFHSGYGLARDLVFVPRFALTADALGVGSVVPRAVPLDAVLGLLTSVVDGAVVFRVALVGVLVVAGCGAHRLGRSCGTPARLLMATVAVWNPYVVERMALGQWALLAGYAALWWIYPAARRAVAGERAAWASLLGWSTLASLTPTGGLLAVLAVTSVAVAAVVRDRSRAPRGWGVVAVAVLWQLPWLLPSLVGASSTTSDASGVDAFSARAERAGGALPTLLGGGGIWNSFSVPATSATWWGWGLTLVAVAALVLGRRVFREHRDLTGAAVVGFLLTLLPVLPGGTALLEGAVAHVPGAGLLRDSHKWLAPYVVLLVLCGGTALERADAWVRGRQAESRLLVAAAAVLVPFVLLPDATAEVWPVVRPVTYPEDLAQAVHVLSSAPASSGVAVTLPWASYREYPWGNPLSAADPAARWADHTVVVRDDLAVPGGVVRGEDRQAARVGEAWESGGLADLREAGVGWLLVYAGAEPPDPRLSRVSDLDPVVEGSHVSLLRIEGAAAPEPVSSNTRTLVLVVDVLWLVAGLCAGAVGGVAAVRRRPGRPPGEAS